MRELVLLWGIAGICAMLAWTLDRPLFATFFAAEFLVAAWALSVRQTYNAD
jgi:hypothetical protein